MSIIATPVLVVTIWLGWSLGSPLFTNVTVEEEFPFAFNAVVPPNMEKADVEEIMAGLAKVQQQVDEAMPGTLVEAKPSRVSENGTTGKAVVIDEADHAMLTKGVATMIEGMEKSDIDKMGEALEMIAAAVDAIKPSQEAAGSPPALRAVALLSGNFMDADAFHRGSGLATIYRGPDGSYVLRLEDLDVTNGPDLHVILTPFANPEVPRDIKVSGYIDLGKLKGNRGNQNYPIPDDVDINSYQSVVVYCKPFSVIFSVASLQVLS